MFKAVSPLQILYGRYIGNEGRLLNIYGSRLSVCWYAVLLVSYTAVICAVYVDIQRLASGR